jgi:asparagine synthetase B (glutamine-hydrolysing)
LHSQSRQSSKDHSEKKLAAIDGPLGVAQWNPSPSSWRLGNGAALVVNYGLFEVVGGHVHRVQPSVYHEEDNNLACVFQGYLSNLDELIERYCDPAGHPSGSSPKSVAARDPREAAAQVIYRMFARGEEPLILLSELQGQYAFALYDSDRKQVFAARDSSGREPLFVEIADDGAISLANSPLSVPAHDGIGYVEWSELLPGHYVAGKGGLKVKQFALTPAQLSAREYYDTLEDELSPTAGSSSGRRSLSDEFAEIGIVG